MTLRTMRTEVNSEAVAYTIATWDDETGDGELAFYDSHGHRSRRCVLTHHPDADSAQPGDVIGQCVWYDPAGNELLRRPIIQP